MHLLSFMVKVSGEYLDEIDASETVMQTCHLGFKNCGGIYYIHPYFDVDFRMRLGTCGIEI